MTFELLEAIIAKNKIPKNVRLVNDSENDLCFMEAECIHKPEHAENEKWKLLWPICDE